MSEAGILAGVFVSIFQNAPPFSFADTTSPAFAPEASVPQSTGQTIVVGHAGDTTAGASRIEIQRLNADGAADTTFGTGGTVLGSASGDEAAFAAAALPGDQFLVAGTSSGHFLLERFNADGTLDSTFGSNGKATSTVNGASSTEIADAVAVGSDGTIVVAGQSDGTWAFTRFSAGGSLLNSFTVALPDHLVGTVGSLAVEADGRIVAAGSDGASIDVARLGTDGSLDPSFNNGSLLALSSLAARTDLQHIDHSVGVAVQPDGKIVVASRTPDKPAKFATERLNSDGGPDTAFGPAQTGVVTTDFSGDAGANQARVNADNTLTISGFVTNSAGTKPASVTYNPDGTIFTPTVPPPPVPPAATFSISGSVLTDQSAPLSGRTVFVDVNGTGLPAGQPQAVTDGNGQFTIAGLQNGSYTLRTVLPQGWNLDQPVGGGLLVTVSGSNQSSQNFVESPVAQVPTTAAGSISGQVFNGKTGAAIAGVTLSLSTGQTTTTDTFGQFSFAGIADGTYTVAESVPAGFTAAATTRMVTVSAGPAGVSFVNTPAASSASNAPQLVGQFRSSLPASIVAGSAQKLVLRLTNTGKSKAAGTINIALFASAANSLMLAEAPFANVPVRVNLRAGASTSVTLRFTAPAGLAPGAYYLIASIDSANVLGEANPASAIAVTSTPTTIAPANATLTASIIAPASAANGKTITLLLTLTNSGNVNAAGTVSLQAIAARDQTGASPISIPAAASSIHLNLKPTHRTVVRVRVRLAAGTLTPGGYFMGFTLRVLSGLTLSNINGISVLAGSSTTIS